MEITSLINDSDLSVQVQRLSQVEKGTALIFNCQMGRGRTTTGMVIATLIHLRRMGSSGNNLHSSKALCDLIEDSDSLCGKKGLIYDFHSANHVT